MAKATVSVPVFAGMLAKAGVIREEEMADITRVVIDVNPNEGVIVYVQKVGDADALAKLAPMLEGMFDGHH